ncbi:Gfo/Idh/MocA family protein [Microbacterium sp. 2MCAF23]|uniref:Gfo/Idh/MocA family protein n=1 Tax=Microbacterium sp. 2MCAF23 TaxID=3232985 RepID=UPI003F947753
MTSTRASHDDARLRWGVVGTGTISRQIASDFGSVGEAQITSVSSRRMDTARSFANEFGIGRVFDDFGQMLAAGVDAVYIATPHVTHFALAKEALSRGIHVLCEKPLG